MSEKIEDLPQELAGRIDEAISQVTDDVVEWRHHLHQHPELSNREEETEKYIVERLQEFGYEDITTGLAGHGVLTVLHGSGEAEGGERRSVLLRADIDALPVEEESDLDFRSEVVDKDYPGGPFAVSHACGHDCHTAMLLGAAKALQELREDVPGDVVFAFQPAEEGPPVTEEGGADVMIGEDAFAKLDPKPTMAFGMHVVPAPKGWVLYSTGVQHAASELLKITVKGEQVHGSQPWAGRDPMPAAADIISAMGQIYRQLNAANTFTISIGHVEDKGRFNIVGEQVTLWGTVRCVDEGTTAEINKRIERTVKNIAAAYDCEGETEFLQEIPPVVNSPEWIEAVLPTFRRVTGDDSKVQQVPSSLGYDDVSEFINAYGGVYALLGVQEVEISEDGKIVAEEGGRGFVPNHSPRFYANDEALETGVRLHVGIAIDHLRGAAVAKEAED